MAYTITVISWGVIDYEDAYVKAGELENVHKMIKWGTDYFLKVNNNLNILTFFLMNFFKIFFF
jgi:hypothetical protein